MERSQEQRNKPPPTPRAETREEKKKTRVERRPREVGSRYMMMPASPISSSSSSASSSSEQRLASSNCPTLPPPPPKNHQPKQIHQQKSLSRAAATTAGEKQMMQTRRSPSVRSRHPPIPSSPGAADLEADEGSCFADENRPEAALVLPLPSGFQGKAPPGAQRKRAVRLFRENCSEQQQQQQPPPEHPELADVLHSRGAESKFLARKPRPGTPIVHSLNRTNLGRSMISGMASRRTATQVNRSLQETLAGAGEPHGLATPSPSDYGEDNMSPENSTVTDFSEAETCSVSSQGGLCDSPPIHAQGTTRVRPSSDCHSSMPDADLLPTMSVSLLMDAASTSSDAVDDSSYRGAASSSFCHRSLNSALSSCQQHPFNPTKSVCKSSTLLKARLNSPKIATFYMPPPQPPNTKLWLESRKGKKMSGRQEDVYALRLLENRYLQWRFINAKAQAAVQSRRIAAEASLYGLSAKIPELNGSVMTKSIELGRLKRLRNLSSVLETQMPYLEEWTTLEADYSCSLPGAIKSLQDASLRLPIMGNVRADITELSEVLDSATNVLAALAPHVGSFLTKAEGMDSVISDLARVVNRERALIEECGDLLSEAHRLQVKECSLRSQLIQLNHTNSMEIRKEN